jgi:hypothetical protein
MEVGQGPNWGCSAIRERERERERGNGSAYNIFDVTCDVKEERWRHCRTFDM